MEHQCPDGTASWRSRSPQSKLGRFSQSEPFTPASVWLFCEVSLLLSGLVAPKVGRYQIDVLYRTLERHLHKCLHLHYMKHAVVRASCRGGIFVYPFVIHLWVPTTVNKENLEFLLAQFLSLDFEMLCVWPTCHSKDCGILVKPQMPFPKNSYFCHQYLILIQEFILCMVELCNDHLPQHVMSVWCELLASCFRSALTISCRFSCVRNHCKWSFHPFKSIQELCWTHTHKPHCLQTALRPGWWRPEIKGGLEGHWSLLKHRY